jgi:hypothetical protein
MSWWNVEMVWTGARRPVVEDELNRLGALLEAYEPDSSSRRKNARLLWVGIAIGVLGLVLAIAIQRSRREEDRVQGALAGTLLAILLLPACTWRLLQLARGARVRILLCTEGLARQDDQDLVTCRWEEIDSVEGILKRVQVSTSVGCRIIITLRLRNGTSIRMDSAKEHLVGLNVLYYRIVTETSRHLLPRCLAAVEAGETVSFGVFRLSKSGLQWGNRLYAWDDRERLDLRDGLQIRDKNRLFHPWIRLGDIPVPNELVFLQLVGHYLQNTRQRS